MCTNANLMTELTQIPYPILVKLPDGNTKSVTHEGTVKLTPDVTLQNVLYIHSFKFNPISVSKLTTAAHARTRRLRGPC